MNRRYTHKADLATVQKTIRELTQVCDDFVASKKCQYALVDTKPIKYGVRLEVSVLSFAPGLLDDPTRGCSPGEWVDLVHSLNRIMLSLPPGVMLKPDAYTTKSKFGVRTGYVYVGYTELLG